MQQSIYDLSLASLSTPKDYTPAVIGRYMTPGTASFAPLEVAKHKTKDDHSILIKRCGTGISITTQVSGLPEEEVRTLAPSVGRFHADGTVFRLYPDGVDAKYFISLKNLPACVQTKNGQSTIYTLEDNKLHAVGPYPAQPSLCAQSTFIDPGLAWSQSSEIMASLFSFDGPSQSGQPEDQTYHGQNLNGATINGQTSNDPSINGQSSSGQTMTGAVPDGHQAYQTHRGSNSYHG
jgi:hypothetical protein